MITAVKSIDLNLEPETLYDRIADEPMAVILDSSLQGNGDNSRFSIVGLNPYLILAEKDGVTTENGEIIAESFEKRLSDYLKDHYEQNATDLPLIAGGIGYFSYDYGRKFENIRTQHAKLNDMPEALFCFYENFIIYDHESKSYAITARGELFSLEESFNRLKALIFSTKSDRNRQANQKSEIRFDFEKEEYKEAVAAMIDAIVEGDIYIANMTQQMLIRSGIAPYTLFQMMRATNPSPFGGYCNYGDFKIVSASPERFIRMKNRLIETKPIKGTRKRGKTATADAILKQELNDSEKDKSELLMIVDLERNDLNRICEAGSVKVTKHFEVQTFATVFHLVTTIIGKMRVELTFADLLRAMFPGGSITGAPKIQAMKTIDALEHNRRGLYTGSIGYLSFNGDCDLNIVIRTAVWQDGNYRIGIGGGITCESDPEFEYEETLQKGKAFFDIFQAGEIK